MTERPRIFCVLCASGASSTIRVCFGGEWRAERARKFGYEWQAERASGERDQLEHLSVFGYVASITRLCGERNELFGERVGGERNELDIGMGGVHSELCLRDD